MEDDLTERPAIDPSTSASLAGRHGLMTGASVRLDALVDLLATDPRAPTSVRGATDALDVHVADSLCGLLVAEVRTAGNLCDLGSGAGFPGLPLALALPHATMRLLDSSRRKCEFLGRAVTAMGVGNVEVVCARAEGWPQGSGRHDAVLARAVAPASVLIEYAAPLLRTGGVLVAWKGRRDSGAEDAGARVASVLGLEPGPVLRTEPFVGARDHHLHVYTKIHDTPTGFPRRPGMARKRPLAGRAPSALGLGRSTPSDRAER